MSLLGLSCVLARNTATFGTPTWVAIEEAIDVTVNLAKSEGTIKSRANSYELNIQALKQTSISFELLHNDVSASGDFDTLRDAYYDDTVIDFLALDGPTATSGSTGFRAECQVNSFTENQPLEEGVTHSVELKPTPTANTQPLQFTAP